MMHGLAGLDLRYVWHPFTQMQEWLGREPIVITSGKGATLRDSRGREYLDANASIWTNLHGHNHPVMNRAVRNQLGKISHCSYLGLANEPASLLAERLVQLANPKGMVPRTKGSGEGPSRGRRGSGNARLAKVFYSDDGSTAMEVALKLAYQHARRKGGHDRPRFLALDQAYHGDTMGAVGLGHIDLFHKAYAHLLVRSDKVMSPYCYRCPFNRAKPERADARSYRRCRWECVSKVEGKIERAARSRRPYAGFVFEPLVQGAAGMITHPSGWLERVAAAARGHGVPLIADEVLTGFGRTGTLFASHKEGVQPDLLAVAKGLTGGYLPLAATLATESIFESFLGPYDSFKTFFHGHSFTGNPLASAAALASLELLGRETVGRARERLERVLKTELDSLWALPQVGDVRQEGLIAGIELVRDWRTREAFALSERAGVRVCEAMTRRGVLTRPIGNVLVLMPPYCTTVAQCKTMVRVLAEGIQEVFARP